MGPWPHSEAGRFHRGIPLVIAAVAIPILAVEAFRNHALAELTVLDAVLMAVAAVSWHLHSAFRPTPANFPASKAVPRAPIPEQTLYRSYRKSKETRS